MNGTTTHAQTKAEIVHDRARVVAKGADADAQMRLERFAQEAIDAHAERFELLQYVAGEGQSRVKTIDARGPARDIAHTAYEFAHHDGQAFAGVTSYALVAYQPGSSSYTERCTFKVAAAMMNDLRPSESPTSAGMQLQSMRHLEVMAFQYSEGMRNVLREKDLTIADLRDDNAKLRAERVMLIDSQMSVIKMREELANDQTQRQLTIERERASIAAKEKLHATFFSIARPILLKKLAAWQGDAPAAADAPAPPPVEAKPKGKGTADVVPLPVVAPPKPRLSAQACESVVEFVVSLNEPTFAAMLGVLSEEQGAKLLALVAQLEKEGEP
jgi:hypothetical protein